MSGTAIRLSCFYAALFSAIGIFLPFWPVWLQSKGLTPGEIGVLLASGYLVKILVNPMIGHVVDRVGSRRLPLVLLSAGALLAFAAFGFIDGFWAVLAAMVLFTSLWSPIMPVGDNLALIKTRETGIDYARVRLWGSLSFIVLATAGGAALESSTPTTLLWILGGALGLTLVSCLALPDAAPPPAAPGSGGVWSLLRSRTFLLFLAASGFAQVSHLIYYGFGTLHWRAQGIGDFTIGWLWSTGVLAEIVLFAWAGRWAAQTAPALLLGLGALAGILRWAVLAATVDVPVLFAAQILHGATFGCTHLGAMHFILRAAPPGLSARAQAVHAAISAGVVPGVAMPFMGPLYESLGGLAYLPMAGLSLLGLLAALALGRTLRV